MTPRIFEIIPGVIVVELPEGTVSVQDSLANGFTYKNRTGYHESWYADEDGGLEGEWYVVNRLSEVTEEQAAGLVYKHEWSDGYYLYKDYEDKLPKDFYHNRITAVESLHSAIKAAGLFTENPVKVHTWASENADDYKKEWHEAQQRTICPERTVVLSKIRR